MVEHFIQCPHPDRQAIWHDIHESIYKANIKHNASTECYNIMAYGLYQGHQAPSNPLDNNTAISRVYSINQYKTKINSLVLRLRASPVGVPTEVMVTMTTLPANHTPPRCLAHIMTAPKASFPLLEPNAVKAGTHCTGTPTSTPPSIL